LRNVRGDGNERIVVSKLLGRHREPSHVHGACRCCARNIDVHAAEHRHYYGAFY
jgi:hypothetical protein